MFKLGYNYNLDLCKLIACIAVIGLHTLMPNVLFVYLLCGFAVPIFFMVSGFNLLDKKSVGFRYSAKKILSIFKIVIMWNTAYCLLKIILHMELTIDSLFDLIIEITKSVIQKGFMWQFWYLGALVILYTLLPIIIKLKNYNLDMKFGIPKVLLYMWFACALIACLIQTTSMYKGIAIQSGVVQTLRIWSWIQYFILGGIMKYIYDLINKKLSFKNHLIILVCYSVFVAVYQYIVGKYIIHNEYAEYFYDSIFVIVWVIIIFSFIMRLKLSEKKCYIIYKMSSLTFGVYIIHPIIIRVVHRIIPNNSGINALLSMFIVMVVSFMVILIMSRFKIIKKLFLAL